MMMLICAVFIFKLRHSSHRNHFSDNTDDVDSHYFNPAHFM